MKRRSGDLARRSPVEWGVRVALASVIAGLGYFTVAQSLAEVLPDRDIERAHQLAPDNAPVTAKLSRLSILADPSATRRGRAEALAREALRKDPTAVAAVTTLGIIAEARQNIVEARRLFAYADQLTRRDLLSRLWLIEDAVRRGDAGQALHHYDIALRTSRASQDILFPVLATASSDPSIAADLVETLKTRPAWAEAFLSFVPSNSGDPRSTARLFLALRKAGVPVPVAAQTTLINTLIAMKRYSEAWAYYATLRPGADRSRSRDPGFSDPIEQPSSFDWVPASSASGLSAAIQRGPNGGLFDFSAPAGIGGQMLRQMQFLPRGIYVLEGHSINIAQQNESSPYWRLACASDDRELGRVIVSNSAENGGHYTGKISVPADCPAQNLEFVARPSNAVMGLAGQLDHLELRLADRRR